MRKKNKGFTLTELLVVIVILGIIAGISIPLVRNLSITMEKRKYKNYADSVLASAKLYKDSYSEDLFGRKENGCAYVTYQQLVEKKLLKDIGISNVSCNNQKTYVKIIKQKEKYGYTNYLACGKDVNGQASSIDVSLPENIPEMDINSCAGPDNNNLSVTVDDKYMGEDKVSKRRKTTSVIISSGTGINNKIDLFTTWITEEQYNSWKTSGDYSAATGFEKASFKIKGDQERRILNEGGITTKSNTLTTPEIENGSQKFYLVVRVDNLQDLYGTKWRNPNNTDSKYLAFGPFSVNNEPPTIIAKMYKCDSSHKKTGDLLASKEIKGTGELDLWKVWKDANSTTQEKMKLVKGWNNKENYPYGVCYEFEMSSSFGIKEVVEGWNASNVFSSSDPNFKKINKTSKKEYTGTGTKTYSTYVAADGYRYTKLTVTDNAGNESSVGMIVYIDKTAPTIKANMYKCNSSHNKTGSALTATKELTGGSGTLNLWKDVKSSMANTLVDGWNNRANYPYGVCYELKLSDAAGIKNVMEGWNASGITSSGNSNFKTITGDQAKSYSRPTSATYNTYVSGDGVRYTKVEVTDEAYNKTTINLIVAIDKKAPTCKLKETKNGTEGVDGMYKCTGDSMSGCSTTSGGGEFSGLKNSATKTVKDKAGNEGTCRIVIEAYTFTNTGTCGDCSSCTSSAHREQRSFQPTGCTETQTQTGKACRAAYGPGEVTGNYCEDLKDFCKWVSNCVDDACTTDKGVCYTLQDVTYSTEVDVDCPAETYWEDVTDNPGCITVSCSPCTYRGWKLSKENSSPTYE